ncbi:HNH endonuclease domain-containing protein [Fictibacillus macauensis ZFHKF-1]|uniref:HNH endonuclease domain-containing protein n=1 Tax=Fictibacillus macauensis ZFHKF-1 TaxID=1196324 RepID=I8AJF5_9BACL|nr:HNH endonuclease domain-containing protein [Fictibacillus macauensis ZFHKF-1]
MQFKRMTRNFARAKNKGEQAFKNYYRNISSNFIKKQEVRNCVFESDNYKCVRCGSEDNLQVDHIVSVYKGYKECMPPEVINAYNNLQTLCSFCNAGKDVSE